MYKNKTILLTGASSGIGDAMARQLASVASHIVLVARREDRMQQLAATFPTSCKATILPCDLTDIAALNAMLDAAIEATGGIDILINNAGFGDVGRFWKADIAKLDRMIALNVTAPTHLAHRLLPTMLERQSGGILNVSSGFGLVWMPRFATYVGTKHFVTGWTESLRAEVQGSGVAISQLCPGPVATEFTAVAQENDTQDVPKWVQLSAEKCAEIGLKGFRHNQALIVPGAAMQVGMALAGLAPRAILRKAMAFTA